MMSDNIDDVGAELRKAVTRAYSRFRASALGADKSQIGVSTAPGTTEFTRMRLGESSEASDLTMEDTAPLLAA